MNIPNAAIHTSDQNILQNIVLDSAKRPIPWAEV